jgi:FimV-like protein
VRVAASFVLGLSLLFPIACGAQAPQAKPSASEPSATYEVKRGDTLFAIARRVGHEGATPNQMVLALYRSNPEAFAGGNINQLRVGDTLKVPSREAVLATAAPVAAREVYALTSAKPPAPLPMAEPRPSPPPVAAVAPKPAPKGAALTRSEAESRYQAGMAFERGGNERAAVVAYTEAGEAGHGLAQKRLGEIYDRGSSEVPRDYQTALKWYQKAREQGVAVPKAEVRAPAIR